MPSQVEATIQTAERYYSLECHNSWCNKPDGEVATTVDLPEPPPRCPWCGWLRWFRELAFRGQLDIEFVERITGEKQP